MTKPSIAVVVLDTLRKDTFDRYFDWVPGANFRNTYSTSHWTIPAHASLLTGRYASELEVHSKSRSFDCHERSIAEVLRESGYSTRMWSENVQINTADGWDRGFDQFLRQQNLDPRFAGSIDWREFTSSSNWSGPRLYFEGLKRAALGSSAAVPSLLNGFRLYRAGMRLEGTTQDVLDRTRWTEFGDDEFLFVNLMTAHTPHHPPQPFRTFDERVNFQIGDAFAGAIENPDRNRRAYDDSAAYLSATYQKIFDELSKDFDYIVTLSDHGELLGEYGLWNHGYGLHPELVRVPLVISGDDISSGDRFAAASLIDVSQTIAELVGIDFESRGRDLLNTTASEDRLVEYHGFLPWHREQFERKGVEEHYDELDSPLSGLVTPSNRYFYERHGEGLCSPTGDLQTGDRTRLQSASTEIPERFAEETDEVSGFVKERLQDMGYA
jgi:arylsulfatase